MLKRTTIIAAIFLCLCLSLNAIAQPRYSLFASDGEQLYVIDLTTQSAMPLEGFKGVAGMALSQDWQTMLVMSQREPEGTKIDLINTATLDIRSLDSLSGAEGMPLWRWESRALLYLIVDNDSLRIMEYDLTREITAERAAISLTADAGEYRLVWWSIDGFALIRTQSDHVDLLPFDNGGHSLPAIPLQGHDADFPVVDAPEVRSLITSDGMRFAIFHPNLRRWEVIDPMTGEKELLADGIIVVEATGSDAPYSATVDIDGRRGYRAMQRLYDTFTPFSETLFDQIAVSPGGDMYASVDDQGLFLQAYDERIALDLKLNPSDREKWLLASAPTLGVIVTLAKFDVDGNTLTIQTSDDELSVQFVGRLAVSPDNDSIIWMAEDEDESIEIWRYRWSNDTRVLLHRVTYADGDPVPQISHYDGRFYQYSDKHYRYRTDTLIRNISREPHPDEDPLPPYEMPLSFYQYGKFGAVLTWDMKGEFIVTDGGGEAGFTPKLFSPDGHWNITVVHPPTDRAIVHVHNTHSFELAHSFWVTALASYGNGEPYLPIWRWDNNAFGYVEFTDETRTEAQFLSFDIVTGETTTLFSGLPTTDGYSFPQPILWTPEIVAMRYRPDSVTAFIIVYDNMGEEIRRVEISDIDADPESRVNYVLPVVDGERTEIGLFYPEQRKWKLIDPMTGKPRDLAPDEWIAEVPLTNVEGTRYGKIIAPEGGEHIVELAPDSDTATIIESASSGLSISPDGQYYSYLTDEALMVGGAEAHLVIETEPFGIGPDSVSWSPTIGRIVRIIGTGRS